MTKLNTRESDIQHFGHRVSERSEVGLLSVLCSWNNSTVCLQQAYGRGNTKHYSTQVMLLQSPHLGRRYQDLGSL